MEFWTLCVATLEASRTVTVSRRTKERRSIEVGKFWFSPGTLKVCEGAGPFLCPIILFVHSLLQHPVNCNVTIDLWSSHLPCFCPNIPLVYRVIGDLSDLTIARMAEDGIF